METIFDVSPDRLDGLENCTTQASGTTSGTSIALSETLKTIPAQKVAMLQNGGVYVPYVEFENLSLTRTFSNHRCDDETLLFDTSKVVMSGSIASNALGTATQLYWNDLVIPRVNDNVEGTLILTHTNEDSSTTTVTLIFDGSGNVDIGGTSLTIADLLAENERP